MRMDTENTEIWTRALNSVGSLAARKKVVKRVAMDYLGAAAIFFILVISCLIVALVLDDAPRALLMIYIVLPILSVISVVFVILSILRFCMLRALARIRSEDEEAVNIECKKVRFITYNPTRLNSVIIGIVFVGADRKKYIYVLSDTIYNSKDKRAEIPTERVELMCYKSTRMVRRFSMLGMELR